MPLNKSSKQAYFNEAEKLFKEYKSVLVCEIDNVGSRQIQEVKRDLIGKAIGFKCVNSFVYRIINHKFPERHDLKELTHHLSGNNYFFFTNGNVKEIAETITANHREAAAKPGQIAPCDVVIPAMVTKLDPSQSSFFISLNIPTKLNKGNVEIVRDIELIKTGDKVTAGQVSLLQKLNMMPFFFSIKVTHVLENGMYYPASALKITDDKLEEMTEEAIKTFTALSLATNYATLPAVPHIVSRTIRKLLGLGIATSYECEELNGVREFLADPSRFAVAEVVEAPKDNKKVEEKREEKKEEVEEEEEEVFGFGGLF
eukprot:gnl/Chilomastix_caulleri/396.p1 GENE.gnl/Chilomastix_caulleri/396~~gnl/Chilomastix_caulleri/396.p1  ORF type:complete len:314 (+),score=120.14 gnl/Chilomastix_caulleri/396:48-989(+)